MNHCIERKVISSYLSVGTASLKIQNLKLNGYDWQYENTLQGYRQQDVHHKNVQPEKNISITEQNYFLFW